MSKAPIVFFSYNRPEHSKKALESLAANEGAKESELFIFCDGPKRSQDEKPVRELRSLVKSRHWCGTVHIIEREKNWGLANSIIDGVTQIVNRYGRVIVLEDDLVLSSQFLNYMNDALEFYKDIPRIMHISGYMFPVKEKLPETFFYQSTSCWGWSTWRRAWNLFEDNPKQLLPFFENKALRMKFNINGTWPFYKTLKRQAQGKMDAWAVRWYASVFVNNGLCLHPGTSLVKNIGHDGTGVHGRSTHKFLTEMRTKRISQFTQDIIQDEKVLKLMMGFYRSIQQSYPAQILQKFKNILTGLI